MRGAMIVVALLTGAAVSGCAVRLGGVRRFHADVSAPIQREAVRILDQAPADATLVASIWGVRAGTHHTAEDDGREIASRMGCDVLVIAARGYEMRDNGVSVGEFPTIEFEAYRTAR